MIKRSIPRSKSCSNLAHLSKLQLGLVLLVALLIATLGTFFATNLAQQKALANETTASLSQTEISVDLIKTGNTSGEATLNRTTFHSGDEVVLTWKGTAVGNDLIVPVYIKLNGNTRVSMEQLNKVSAVQTANSEYKRRVGSDGTLTTYDSLKDYLTSEHSISLGATYVSSNVEIQYARVSPVYRMYNIVTSEHLFSTNKTEYDAWVAKSITDQDFWVGEGIDWLAPTSSTSTSTVHRLYNEALGEMGHSSHYYTADLAEIANLVANHGWVDDGVDNQFESGGTTAIYTCYNELLASAHHYTSSKSEWSGLAAHGWDLEEDKNGTNPVKDPEGVFQCTMATNWSFTPNYYTVEHRLQNLDGTYSVKDTEVVSGSANVDTKAEQNSYPGYTPGVVTQQNILQNNSTKIQIDYTLNSYDVKFVTNESSTTVQNQNLKFGSSVSNPGTINAGTKRILGWYTDSALTKEFNFGTDKVPVGGITLYAKWSAENIDVDPNVGTTDENGQTTVPDQSQSNRPTKIQITYDDDGDSTTPEVPLDGAKVVIGKDGVIKADLPAKAQGKDVTVNAKDENGNPIAGKAGIVTDANGDPRPAKVTDANGDAKFPGTNKGTTDNNGDVSIVDPSDPNKGRLNIEVTYDDDGDPTTPQKPLKDAQVEARDDGTIAVDLPEKALGKDVTVNVKDANNNPIVDKDVKATESNGDPLGEEKTDKAGDAKFAGSLRPTTGDDGSALIVDPTTGETIKVTVTCDDDNDSRTDEKPVPGATLRFGSYNILEVTAPDSVNNKSVTVTITYNNIGVKGQGVVLKEASATTQRGSKQTDTNGVAKFGFGNYGVTDTTGSTTLSDPANNNATLKVTVSTAPAGTSTYQLLSGASVEATTTDEGVRVIVPAQNAGQSVEVKLESSDAYNRPVTLYTLDNDTPIATINTDIRGISEFTYYLLTLNLNGGSGVEYIPVFSGKTPTKPENPTKDGWNFSGWYSDVSLTTTFDFNVAMTSNKEAYAKWLNAKSQGGYWLAPANSSDPEGEATKSAEEIQADIHAIRSGNATVIAEYNSYATNDNYHLYTHWSGENRDGANAWLEFRVISVLTDRVEFQATHALPVALKPSEVWNGIDTANVDAALVKDIKSDYRKSWVTTARTYTIGYYSYTNGTLSWSSAGVGAPAYGNYHEVSTYNNKEMQFYVTSIGYTHDVSANTRNGSQALGAKDSSRFWTGDIQTASYTKNGSLTGKRDYITLHDAHVYLSTRTYNGQAGQESIYDCEEKVSTDGLSTVCVDQYSKADLALSVYPSFML